MKLQYFYPNAKTGSQLRLTAGKNQLSFTIEHIDNIKVNLFQNKVELEFLTQRQLVNLITLDLHGIFFGAEKPYLTLVIDKKLKQLDFDKMASDIQNELKQSNIKVELIDKKGSN